MIGNKKGYDPCLSDIWACGVILFIMLAGFPPFQKPAMSDWWFAKLATGKHALFWQAHSRSAYFSDATKDFINKILNPDPTKRLTIADIRKHPWFTGATIGDAALTAELTRRKLDVDEAKNRQKLEKKSVEAASAGSTDGALESELVRDVPLTPMIMYREAGAGEASSPTAGADEMPSANPAMAWPGNGAALFPSQSPFGEASVDGFGDSKAAAVPAPFNADEHVTCYTRFDSTAKPAYLMERISAVLATMNARTSTLGPFSLRAIITTATGQLTVSAQVYSDQNADGGYVVLFRRRQGDSMQYRSIYQDIRTRLQDLVTVKKHTASAAAASATVAWPGR